MKVRYGEGSRQKLIAFLTDYGLAVATTALAALLRWMFPWALAPAPYLGFYPAVVVSAALGGVGPGLVATFGALLLVNFVFGQFNVNDFGAMARQIVWVTASLGVSVLAGMQHASRMRERLKAEDLRESEERYRSIIENLQDGYIRANREGIVIMASPSAARMYRLNSPQEMLGLSALSLYKDPEDRRVLLEALKKTGKVNDFESEALRKDGESFPVSLNVQFFYDAQGQFGGTEAFVRDIAGRKRAEEALRSSEEQFRTLVDSIPNLAWWANGDGYITWYNQRWYEYTGTTPEQMEGWGWQSVHDPNILPSVLKRWKASIATGEPFDMEFPLLGADGVFRPFLTRVMPLKDTTGRVHRWFGTNTDVSALKQTEKMMAHLAAIVQSADDAIISKDMNGVVQTWNVGAEKIFGYTAQEMIGRNISVLVPPGHTNEIPDILKRISRGEYIDHFETERMRKDGSIVPILLTYSPIKDVNGTVVGVSKIAHDITERKKAEQVIVKLNQDLAGRIQELVTANNELESFSYSVSHDLRAPLRHMSSYVALLNKDLDGTASDKSKHYLKVIAGASRKMGMLIDDLLAFSRMGRADLQKTTVNMTVITNGIIREMATDIKERNIEWKIRALPDVHGDTTMLRLAVLNLISNAIKYTSPRSKAEIEIGCTEDVEEYIFFIRDNGVGFNMEYVDKLFGVFQRLHKDTEFEGTGIGLANVQRIISRHGGRTWAEGAVGQGAVFYFTIPKIKEI